MQLQTCCSTKTLKKWLGITPSLIMWAYSQHISERPKELKEAGELLWMYHKNRVLKALSFFTFVQYWWISCAWGWGGVQDTWHEAGVSFLLPVTLVVEKWDANTHSLMKHTSFPFCFLFSNLVMGWDLGSHKQARDEKISLSYIIIARASQVAQWSRICLQCRRPAFDPWILKIPWRREW